LKPRGISRAGGAASIRRGKIRFKSTVGGRGLTKKEKIKRREEERDVDRKEGIRWSVEGGSRVPLRDQGGRGPLLPRLRTLA